MTHDDRMEQIRVMLYYGDSIHTRKNILTLFFTARRMLRMQARYNCPNSVCPSVSQSVIRVLCDETKERTANILIPYEIFLQHYC